tara:strand:- start:835 stop:1728 length:894 start_codon:yes stop_codon:yes gene_type:complete
MIKWEEQTLRSLLFAPGNHKHRLEKVGTFGADGIVLDLEDAVPESEKNDARELVLGALHTYNKTPVVCVRVNSHETGRMEEDIIKIVHPELNAIMVPKIESADTLKRCDALLYALERERNLQTGSIKLIGLIETPIGLIQCDDVATQSPPRTIALGFGLGDFSTAMQLDLTVEGDELLYARSRLLTASRAAGLRAPIDGPFLDIPNKEGLLKNTKRSKALGFEGRVAIHPDQVDIVQKIYSDVSEEDARRSELIVEAFEKAIDTGSASIQVEGQFVDGPIYERALQKVRLFRSKNTN